MKGYPTGWMVKGTQGPILNGLINKTYRLVDTSNGAGDTPNTAGDTPNGAGDTPNTAGDTPNTAGNTKAERKVMELDRSYGDTIAFSTSALAHVFHSDHKWFGFTGGLGLDGAKNPQIMLGLSFLCHIDEQRLLAFTLGGISGKVKILDGYKDGDPFSGDTLPTKMVNRPNWFAAITFNFNSLFGQNRDTTPPTD